MAIGTGSVAAQRQARRDLADRLPALLFHSFDDVIQTQIQATRDAMPVVLGPRVAAHFEELLENNLVAGYIPLVGALWANHEELVREHVERVDLYYGLQHAGMLAATAQRAFGMVKDNGIRRSSFVVTDAPSYLNSYPTKIKSRFPHWDDPLSLEADDIRHAPLKRANLATMSDAELVFFGTQVRILLQNLESVISVQVPKVRVAEESLLALTLGRPAMNREHRSMIRTATGLMQQVTENSLALATEATAYLSRKVARGLAKREGVSIDNMPRTVQKRLDDITSDVARAFLDSDDDEPVLQLMGDLSAKCMQQLITPAAERESGLVLVRS